MAAPIVVSYRGREIVAVREPGRRWRVEVGGASASERFLHDALHRFVRNADDVVALTVEILEKELSAAPTGEPTTAPATIAARPEEA